MIKKITITNHIGESIDLSLTNPYESGFLIKSISGLGPVKADINFTEMSTNDGAIDNTARLQTRNIVMSLGFIEKPTIEETRLRSYKYFPIKRTIRFRIETDTRVCETTGRIESNEPSMFDKEEGCQISILCADPYFYSEKSFDTLFYGTKPKFTFPFSNESLTEKKIIFGEIYSKTEAIIPYDGDVETGMVIKIHAIGPAEGVKIYDVESREIMILDDTKFEQIMGSGITAGDEIIISTIKGKKGITLLRSGTTTNILNALTRPIPWFQLSKGENQFAYTASEGLANLQFRIENKVLFEGV